MLRPLPSWNSVLPAYGAVQRATPTVRPAASATVRARRAWAVARTVDMSLAYDAGPEITRAAAKSS